MPQALPEMVMVFPTKLLHDIGYFQGLRVNIHPYLSRIFDPNTFLFKLRSEVERDPNFKQVIPYIILKYRDSIFRYARGSRTREERLHKRYSVGLGGHISQKDATMFSYTAQFYDLAAEREAKEEVYIETGYQDLKVAVLNDDSDEVGKVHFGIVQIYALDEPRVRKKEPSITDARFESITSLKNKLDRFESWSQFCIGALVKGELG